MELVTIHRCLANRTRLRILHLLLEGPLCVSHLQKLLNAPQVAVSKHLAYLRTHGFVEVTRQAQWMIHRLPAVRPRELDLHLECLRQCAESYPVLRQDRERLQSAQADPAWTRMVARRENRSSTPSSAPASAWPAEAFVD